MNINKRGWKIISWACGIVGAGLFVFCKWLDYNKELFELVNQWLNTESLSWIGIVMAVGGFILIMRIDDLYEEHNKKR